MDLGNLRSLDSNSRCRDARLSTTRKFHGNDTMHIIDKDECFRMNAECGVPRDVENDLKRHRFAPVNHRFGSGMQALIGVIMIVPECRESRGLGCILVSMYLWCRQIRPVRTRRLSTRFVIAKMLIRKSSVEAMTQAYSFSLPGATT